MKVNASMNRSSAILLAASAVLTASALQAASLSVGAVNQRYPWNGLVDIDYEIALGEGEEALDPLRDALYMEVSDNATTPATVYEVKSILQAPLPMTAGTHRITWDAGADGLDRAFTNATFRMKVNRWPEKYLVVDLHEGKTATSYPISYLDAVPENGFTNDVYRGDKMVFRLIPPGSFVMGSPAGEVGRQDAREAQRPVRITRPFYLSVFEPTQMQYHNVASYSFYFTTQEGHDYWPAACMTYASLRGSDKGGKWPQTNDVDSSSFCGLLRARTGLVFDLPTEAQWEYACRAGTTTPLNDGIPCTTTAELTAQMKKLGLYNAGGLTAVQTVVGSYEPNDWGVYDMHGNASELCRDWFREDLKGLRQFADPVGPSTDGVSTRTTRGGSAGCFGDGGRGNVTDCRSAARTYRKPADTGNSVQVGFRLCVETVTNVTPTVIASAEKELPLLELQQVWDRTTADPVAVSYSSLGWDVTPEDERGNVVTLELTANDGERSVLASSLAGYMQTFTWTPTGVTRQGYEIHHVVSNGGVTDADATLTAVFSFVNLVNARAGKDEIEAALFDVSYPFDPISVVSDETNPWQPIGGVGEGLAPLASTVEAGTPSSVSASVRGVGTLTFDYRMGAGALEVRVDGTPVRTLPAAGEWTRVSLSVGLNRPHLVTFAYAPGAGDAVQLKNVKWLAASELFSGADSAAATGDFREGALVARRSNELMPFTWSSTNFTGNALVSDRGFVSIDPQSVASVRVVRVTGEDEDVSQWTEEVAGTAKTLVAEKQGEGAVEWRHVKPGVWKAELVITPPAGEGYRETRILDLRNYAGPGLMIFVM